MIIPAPAVLVPTELACGHQRRVDQGISSLVDEGVIDSLWCVRCSADQPTVAKEAP